MINFREIFNINYSYIGLGVIAILMIILILMDRKESIKVMGFSFVVSGLFLLVVYLLGNMIVSSFSYKFFIEVISDNFFRNIIIFATVSLGFGGIGLGVYKYIS